MEVGELGHRYLHMWLKNDQRLVETGVSGEVTEFRGLVSFSRTQDNNKIQSQAQTRHEFLLGIKATGRVKQLQPAQLQCYMCPIVCDIAVWGEGRGESKKEGDSNYKVWHTVGAHIFHVREGKLLFSSNCWTVWLKFESVQYAIYYQLPTCPTIPSHLDVLHIKYLNSKGQQMVTCHSKWENSVNY